jgi:hypothetical protein
LGIAQTAKVLLLTVSNRQRPSPIAIADRRSPIAIAIADRRSPIADRHRQWCARYARQQ